MLVLGIAAVAIAIFVLGFALGSSGRLTSNSASVRLFEMTAKHAVAQLERNQTLRDLDGTRAELKRWIALDASNARERGELRRDMIEARQALIDGRPAANVARELGVALQYEREECRADGESLRTAAGEASE